MSYVPPTFTALSAELQSSEEVGVVARHFIETRSEADLVALLADGLRLHRQLTDVTQALTGALHTAIGLAAPAATPAATSTSTNVVALPSQAPVLAPRRRKTPERSTTPVRSKTPARSAAS